MPTRKNPLPCRTLPAPSRLLIAALAAAAGCAASAQETSPYYIGVKQSLTYDSNVYRIGGGPSDIYSNTSLIGGIDQPIGRQRLYGTANLGYNKYKDESTLDNVSYGLAAGLDWQTVNRLSGNVNVGANQSLANLNGNSSQNTTRRNLVKYQQIGTAVRWGADGPLSLEGTYSHSAVRYSAPESLRSEADTDSVSAGVFYRLGPDLRAGTALRYTRTDSPYAIPLTAPVLGVPASTNRADYTSNTSNVRYLDLLADWRPTVRTSVNGRVSLTRQTNSASGGRDFSGLTGSLAATYAPTAKITLNTSLGRDVGNNSNYFSQTRTTAATSITGPITQTISGLAESSAITDTFAIGAAYEATAKIGVTLGYQYRRSELVDTIAVTGTTFTDTNARTDNFRILSLGANYAYSRSVAFACTASHESRSVGGLLPIAYSANVIGCSGQFTFR